MSLIDYLYPKHCPVCLDALPPGKTLICKDCIPKIRYVKGALCYKCGKPLSDGSREYCRNCEARMPSFLAGISWAEYTSFYTQNLMIRVKYFGDSQLLDFPCKDFIEKNRARILGWKAEALIPVPVHPEKLLKRGYNQAEEIANRFSASLGIPVLSDCLIRNENTKAQKSLTGVDRAMNLFRAFSLAKPLPVKTVILIDDIYTTGATAEACTRVLLQGGAKAVYFLSLAIGRDDSIGMTD